MPKPTTFPTFFEDTKQLTIADLKRLGYLRPGHSVCSVLNWGSGGGSQGSIQVTASVDECFVYLAYEYNERPVRYRIPLESVPRHFGGCEWYFICPATGRRCRKLYQIGEYFLSRFAFPSAMYREQAASRSNRSLYAAMRTIDLHSKFFDRRCVHTKYRGKPTKAYRRFLDQQNASAPNFTTICDLQKITDTNRTTQNLFQVQKTKTTKISRNRLRIVQHLVQH